MGVFRVSSLATREYGPLSNKSPPGRQYAADLQNALQRPCAVRLSATRCQSILSGVKKNGLWRRRMNSEIYKIFREPDVIKNIKIRRMKWAAHVSRMDEGNPVKKVFVAKPFTPRRRGRPNLRWLDSVESDFKIIGVKNWRTRAKNRQAWWNLQQKALAHSGLSSQK